MRFIDLYSSTPLFLFSGITKDSESAHEKTNNLGFRPGPTQNRLYSHRIKLEA